MAAGVLSLVLQYKLASQHYITLHCITTPFRTALLCGETSRLKSPGGELLLQLIREGKKCAEYAKVKVKVKVGYLL